MKTKSFLLIISIFLVITGACASSENTTTISSADLFLDPEGTLPTEKYDARAIFYCIVTLDQAAPDTILKASWVAVETNRSAPDFVIKIEEIVPTSDTVVFKLQNAGNFWPTGNYKIFLYLDGIETRVIDFEVYHDYFSE